MQTRRINILLVEPSTIIRKGILSILLDLDSIGINITEVEEISSIKDKIDEYKPDFVIINPLYLGIIKPKDLVGENHDTKFIALLNQVVNDEQITEYISTISLSDTIQQIEDSLMKFVRRDIQTNEVGLSSREREIVGLIARGKSNKDIAEELFISLHTVTTHRKNIASKLKIHNPAGLTIYAIINKLIDIKDIPV